MKDRIEQQLTDYKTLLTHIADGLGNYSGVTERLRSLRDLRADLLSQPSKEERIKDLQAKVTSRDKAIVHCHSRIQSLDSDVAARNESIRKLQANHEYRKKDFLALREKLSAHDAARSLAVQEMQTRGIAIGHARKELKDTYAELDVVRREASVMLEKAEEIRVSIEHGYKENEDLRKELATLQVVNGSNVRLLDSRAVSLTHCLKMNEEWKAANERLCDELAVKQSNVSTLAAMLVVGLLMGLASFFVISHLINH